MERRSANPLRWALLLALIALTTALMAAPISVKECSLQVNTAEAATSNELVQVATAHVGNGGSTYRKYFGASSSAAWCHMFVSWCAKQVGIEGDLVPHTARCADGVIWFKNKKRFHQAGSYIPKRGDIIYFYSSKSSCCTKEAHHVGIVTSYSKGRVHTIEGNCRNLVKVDGGFSNGYAANGSREGRALWVLGYGETFADEVSAPITHPIEYNLSGGSGSFSNINVAAGGKVTIPSAKPTKAGYVFKGWALKRLADQKWNSRKGWVSKEHVSQNGGYRLYSPGAQLTLDASWTYGYAGGATKFRFNAIWEKVASKAYFSTNGGTGSYSTISSTYGSQFKMPAAKPTKSGYTFKGWALKRLGDQKWITTKGAWVSAADVAANGGYRVYAAGTDRTFVPSWYAGCEGVHVNFRFYAQWEKVASTTQMSFAYNLNGGSGSFAAQTGNMGGTLLMPSAKPTRVGYKFTNWALKREGDGLWYSKQGNWVAQSQLSAEGGNYAYGAGTTRNLNASWLKGYTGTNYKFTFYAQWEPIAAKYTFGLNGGTGSYSTLNLKFGDKFSLPAAKPTKQYYTFKGWIVKRVSDDKWMSKNGGWVDYNSVPDKGGYKVYAPSASHAVSASWINGYTKGDVEFRFYADYEKNSGVFEFTFGLNGGEGSHQSTACLSGGTITLPKDKPTKSGYTFKGWAVKRIGDANWVSMKGWVASKNVASNGGYRYYSAGKTLTIDASWTKGYTGSVRDYRFFAQWEPNNSLKAA